MAFTLDDKRESVLLTVFLWNNPLVTPLIISGCAAFKHSAAPFGSLASIASSTLLMKVLILDLLDFFISVRLIVCRTLFFAETEFAIDKLSVSKQLRGAYTDF